MFLKIDDENLNRISLSSDLQEAGQTLKDKVKNLKYDYVSHNISAVVDDGSPYDISLEFDDKGLFGSSVCTCPKGSSGEPCKHTFAVLYMTRDKFLQKKQPKPFIEQDTNLLPRLKPWVITSEQKKKINCAAFCKYYYNVTDLPYVDIELKLGVERLYTIKEIRKLLDSIEQYSEYPLGKVFSFDFQKHTLELNYKNLLLFLLRIHKTEKALLRINEGHGFMWNTGTNPLSCFKGKVVRLGGDLLAEYLDTMLGSTMQFSFNDGEFAELKVVEEDIEIVLDRSPAKEGMLLSVLFKDNIMPLMPDYSYVLNVESNVIIKMPESKKEILGKLFSEMSATNSNSFIITREFYDDFNNGIFPHLKKNMILITTTNNSKQTRTPSFIARLHYDISRKGVVASVRFIYGKTIINPFAETKTIQSYISNRNIPKEVSLLSILYDMGFEVHSSRLLLEDVNKISDFIKDNFSRVKNKFDYSFTEKFKNVKIIEPDEFSFEISVDDSNNPYITFNSQFDDLELSEILGSINLNKKFHFSRTGLLIKINKPEFKSASGILGKLGIALRDIKDGKVDVPVNKLPFIPTYVKENNIPINLSDKLINTVDSLITYSNTRHEIPDCINATLREYQITGFNWLKTLSSFHLGGILADDMGLGKTIQMLTFIRDEVSKSKLPAIVVAPTSLIYNWYDEATKFVPDLKVAVIAGSKTERSAKIDDIKSFDLVVTSFGLLKNDIEQYQDIEFAYCIVDEAQNIKNVQTLNSETVKKIRAKCSFALTGTPVENNLMELWSIFDFVLPGHLPNYNKFLQKFEKPITKDGDKEAAKMLAEIIRPFVLRRLKKDVLTELPEKIETVISNRMTPEQEKLYFAFLGKGIHEIKNHISTSGFDKSRFEILALLTRLRQICSHPALFLGDYPGGSGKLELLFDIVENSLRGGHRMLIFSQFSTMLDLIKAGLEERGVEYFSLDGKTPSSERVSLAKRFNEGESSIFLISLKAGGTGLNLTGADIVVHFDPWWNPAVEDQASDRAYRIGQTKVVQVFKLITHNTIEEKIYALQQKKKDLINSVIKSGEVFEDSLSEAEILEVLGINSI